MFGFLQLFALVLGVSGVTLGVVQRNAVLDYYLPCLTPGALITSTVVYLATRWRLEIQRTA